MCVRCDAVQLKSSQCARGGTQYSECFILSKFERFVGELRQLSESDAANSA